MTKNSTADSGFLLAHVSDPHFAAVEQMQLRDYFTKRLFGSLRWKYKRQAEYDTEILTILADDLQRAKPDHTVITGDLTQLGFPAEFIMARDWLESIGTPKAVTVVPGNHDSYIETCHGDTYHRWLEYMSSDIVDQAEVSFTDIGDTFPSLRIRDKIALVGLSTAYPSRLYQATGRIGTHQLAKAEKLLQQLADKDFFCVILIHHPPVTGITSRRKSLLDMDSLQQLISKYGVDLVLFGHTHKLLYEGVATKVGLVPAIGAPAAASNKPSGNRQAGYILLNITSCGERWTLQIRERIFSHSERSFIDGMQQEMSLPAKL